MFRSISSPDVERLGAFLREQGYTEKNFKEVLGVKELPATRFRNLPRQKELTKEPNTINTLLRWFWVGLAQNVCEATERLPGWFIPLALECGLLQQDGSELRPQAMLCPMGDFVFASDHISQIDSNDAELVLWPNPTSRLLSRMTIRRPSHSTLDLGTGSGVQALLAADHSDTVVATDLNPRAVNFAAFSARLNGVSKVEFLVGDGFAPVSGRTFDLIVSNPPFFITPAAQYLFCDNPLELDQLCRNLVQEAPLHLNEGGYFQILCEWAGVEGESWQARLSEWFEGTGCDAIALKGYSQDPGEYAEQRIRERMTSSATDADLYDSYMDYYRARRVVAIHGGALTMRRRSGTNWVLLEEVEQTPKHGLGDLIADMFERRGFLLSHESDEEMMQLKPKFSADLRLEQVFQPTEDGWKQKDLTLTMSKGFNPVLGVQPMVAEFLIRCNGTRPLGEIITSFRAEIDVPLEQVQQECLGAVRKLLERGFLQC